jgi:hypothetical protein
MGQEIGKVGVEAYFRPYVTYSRQKIFKKVTLAKKMFVINFTKIWQSV